LNLSNSTTAQAISALIVAPALLILLGCIERRSFVRSERHR
jgi:predicted benzoate:H+ symporter BenE